MPYSFVDTEPERGYAAQLEALRSVAKWLVAALAGVGGLLLAGLPISGVGKLPASSWRLYVAGASIALGLSAVAFMIREASVVLTHEWLTLASFGDEPTGETLKAPRNAWRQAQLREIEQKLAVSRHELFGYVAQSRTQLHRLLREADEQIYRSAPGSEDALNAMRAAAMLRKAARDTVQYANYCFTLKLFQRMRTRIGVAAIVAAASISIYAYSANPPHPARLTGMQRLPEARVRSSQAP